MLIILGSLATILLSNTNRERLKSKAYVIFPDHTIIMFSGIIILLMTFIVLQTVCALSIIIPNVSTGKGIVFSFIGGFFILFWGILAYRAQKKELFDKMYISNAQDLQNDLTEYEHILGKKSEKDVSNMTLPI